jgi:hypothetical protein
MTTSGIGSWDRPRRVVAKVEWHRGELFSRVGFIVTNMSASPGGVLHFYNGRGTAEQWIKEQVRAELDTTVLPPLRGQPGAFVAVHPFDMLRTGLAYNLGNFLQ